ncbi:MAG: sigma-70 family RNA polymerase sigma factor [Flavobacteriales bacterium]|jgi:RNA polymerase sigma-70 factor (ECF subfamily)|nr:sigma-70 family RNA polymerase sigma factor [Flavobacteriales bacterium]
MEQRMDHADLIQRILSGESRAFGELVQRYQHMVYTVCMRVLRNAEDAEEASQDAFVKAFRNLSGFTGGSKFSTWLYTIAYRSAISRARQRRTNTDPLDELVHQPVAAAPRDGLHRTDVRHYLNQALEKLTPEESTILSLHYLDELSVEEIVTITGLSASNVKVRLFRSRKRLEAALNTELNGEARSLLLNDA